MISFKHDLFHGWSLFSFVWYNCIIYISVRCCGVSFPMTQTVIFPTWQWIMKNSKNKMKLQTIFFSLCILIVIPFSPLFYSFLFILFHLFITQIAIYFWKKQNNSKIRRTYKNKKRIKFFFILNIWFLLEQDQLTHN